MNDDKQSARQAINGTAELLEDLVREFKKVFPIYYYAEPWAHDRCPALINAELHLLTLATPQPVEVQPVGYLTGPLLWKERQSEQVVKITRLAQPMYGFTCPLLIAAQPVALEPLTDAEIKKSVAHQMHSGQRQSCLSWA